MKHAACLREPKQKFVQSAVDANAQENRAGLPLKVRVALACMVSYVRVAHVVMVDGFFRTSAQWKNGAARLKDGAATFLRAKAAPLQICSIGLVQRMGLARCQCGQIKTALLSFLYSSRDWGGAKSPGRVTKSFRRVLRDWRPSLKRRAMIVHTDSHVVGKKNSLGHSGFDSNSLTVSKEWTDDYCNSTV